MMQHRLTVKHRRQRSIAVLIGVAALVFIAAGSWSGERTPPRDQPGDENLTVPSGFLR
ncbi:MAG: hypothetical protein R2705_10710 [Ilumatobacteraceae bacterium]